MVMIVLMFICLRIALATLFARLLDAHTRYDIPKGYSAFVIKPFSLQVKRNLTTGAMQY